MPVTAEEKALIAAVRNRAPGVSLLAAFREPVLDGLARLEADETARLIAKSAALINASPSLQVRERELVARYTEVLARLIAAERDAEADDVEASGVATALMGTQRALVAYVRARAESAGGPRAGPIPSKTSLCPPRPGAGELRTRERLR
jgi:hypothetical protein